MEIIVARSQTDLNEVLRRIKKEKKMGEDEDKEIYLRDNSFALDYYDNRTRFVAVGDAVVRVYGRARLFATDRAAVFAHDRALVIASGRCNVVASGRSRVFVSEGACVAAYEDSQAVADGLHAGHIEDRRQGAIPA